MKAVDELIKNDINAVSYRRGPFGNITFAMRVVPETKEGAIKVWQPQDMDVEVVADKKFRQAVVSASEDARKIARNVRFETWRELHTTLEARPFAITNFPVAVPRGTTYRVRNLQTLRKPKNPSYGSSSFRYSVDMVAKIPESNQNFLVGMDETYHFIAELPQAAESVEHAHDILRPRTVPEGSLRQGEWFFVPVSDYMQKVLMNYVLNNPTRRIRQRTFDGRWESTHFGAQVTTYRGNIYAMGIVYDSRQGHHKALNLPVWHKVMRNREVVQRRARARWYD